MHYVLARLNKLLDSLVDTNYNLNVRSDGRRKTAIVNRYFTIIRVYAYDRHCNKHEK